MNACEPHRTHRLSIVLLLAARWRVPMVPQRRAHRIALNRYLEISDSKSWNYLGHQDNLLPGGARVSIPEEDFPMDLRIETTRGGEEFFIAFATEERLDEAALLEIREELAILRGKVDAAEVAA